MISLNQYKKLLGTYADTKSDEELLSLMAMQYKLAGIGIDLWESENLAQKDIVRDNIDEPHK